MGYTVKRPTRSHPKRLRRAGVGGIQAKPGHTSIPGHWITLSDYWHVEGLRRKRSGDVHCHKTEDDEEEETENSTPSSLLLVYFFLS